MKQRLVVVSLLLGMSLFAILVSCATTTLSDPIEVKKKRMAEIVNELFNLNEEMIKNPQLQNDPAMQERAKKLGEEGDKLIKELSGFDKTKEEDTLLDIIKQYCPQHLEKILDARNNARIAKAKAQLRNIQIALESYNLDYGKYPTDEEGLAILTKNNGNRPPIMEVNMLKDPWGNPIIYKLANPYIIKSLGPDGKEGTEDDIEVK